MARSEYVYVVTRPPEHGLLAAFTVKHELASWLYGRRLKPSGVTVTRVEDAPLGKAASQMSDMDVRELLQQGYTQALRYWNRMQPDYREGRGPQPPDLT